MIRWCAQDGDHRFPHLRMRWTTIEGVCVDFVRDFLEFADWLLLPDGDFTIGALHGQGAGFFVGWV